MIPIKQSKKVKRIQEDPDYSTVLEDDFNHTTGRKYLQSTGAKVTKIAGSKFQGKGIADFLCCYCGFFIAVEVKRNDGVMSPTQQNYRTEVLKAGGAFILWTYDKNRFIFEVWLAGQFVKKEVAPRRAKPLIKKIFDICKLGAINVNLPRKEG